MKKKTFNDVKGLVNQNEFINISIEPMDEKEIARLKKEQDIQHLTNICKYLAYTQKSVLDKTWGVVISSHNTEGNDWFYEVENAETGDMITYWCYCDELTGEKDTPEVCAAGMMEYMDKYFAQAIA